MKPPYHVRTTKDRALSRAVLALGSFLVMCAAARAQFVYITNFTKTNNIYTDLNEQFPASGTGVPGSGVGTPNASIIFDPSSYSSANYVAGSNLSTNGATFQVASDSGGRDFSEITSPLTIAVNQNVSSVYLLMASYYGTTANVTFTGADSSTETFTNVDLPDFNGGAPINQSAMVNGSLVNNYFDQTVLQVHNVGGGGTGNSTTGSFNYYDLVEPSFLLDSTLSSEMLTSITITPNGSTPLLMGVSFLAVPEPPSWMLLAIALPLAAFFLRRRLRPSRPAGA